MSAAFTINGQTPDQLCLRAGSLSLATGGQDSAELTFASSLAAQPFTYRQTIAIALNGEIIFRGTVSEPARRSSPNGSDWVVRVAGYGSDLDHVVLEQSVKGFSSGSLIDQDVSRVWLGIDATGEHEATGVVLRDIIDYAATKGSQLQSGLMLTGRKSVQTEVVDTSCGDALRQYARLEPDGVMYVDGAGSMNFLAPTSLPLVSFSSAEIEDAIVDVAKADGLAPVGVKIIWEKTVSDDGRERVEREIETAGATVGWPPPIVMTIELAGASTTYEKEPIRTRTLPTSATLTTDASKKFFKGLAPFLSTVSESDLAIENFAIEIVPNRYEDGVNSAGDSVDSANGKEPDDAPDIGDMPRQLLSGAIQPWMNVESAQAKLSATIYYKGTDATVIKAIGGTRRFSQTAGQWYSALDLREVPLEVTDALPKVYKSIDSFEAGESPIPNLASAYFSAIQSAPYVGSASAHACHKLGQCRPGKRVQFPGMASPGIVQQTSYDLIGETVNLRTGLPDHLAPQDTVELARAMNANRPRWVNPEERTEALATSERGGPIGAASAVAMQPVSTALPTGPWSLNYDEASQKFSVNVGTISDQENPVEILEPNATFSPSDLDCIYLELDADGLDLLVQTVEEVTLKCGQWTTFPQRYSYNVSGGVPVLEYGYCALWQFHTNPQDDPTCIAMGDFYIRRLMPLENFEVVNDIATISDKYTGSTVWLRPGAGLIEAPED